MRTVFIGLVLAGVSMTALAKGENYNALVAKAKAEVSKDFKDPESANFRNLGVYKSKTGKGRVSVCGEVNAKNAFGAYVGYRPFVVSGELAALAEPDGEGLYKTLAPSLCHELVRSIK
ncbi:hypothetical protein HNP33_002079 [Comamonas odontotermitis]|uniref:Uncharacterized protein n=1 Tax=Comamonas odontotermitis TaxID=379895 RepID=A0ABR6RFT1_9BURK|nr:hypothetical protein [Comamonas odontotermitis]MBB6578011.1 hypothetical protein [Comamonas odontotermitis]